VARDSRLLALLGASLVLALGVGSASASSAVSSSIEIAHWNGTAWTRVATPNVSGGTLSALTAASRSDAWAVGDAVGRLFSLHWNGESWRQVAIPTPRGSGSRVLAAVSASPPHDVWAVGYWKRRTLIEHWNGKRWTQVPSPANGAAGYLRGVSALSPTDVWAVGSHGARTLILHWNGRRWTRTPSPNPGPAGAGTVDELWSVSAIAAGDAWAVGSSAFARANGARNLRTLVLHWNGRRWASVASPNEAPLRHGDALLGVTGFGAAAWAVGAHGTGRGQAPLAESMTGGSWRLESAPPGTSLCCTDELATVVAVSATSAWAAGHYSNISSSFSPLVEHWDGISWTKSPVSSAIRLGSLTGIAATADTDVWVVGVRMKS
jgi:hypothetical protein